MEDYSLSALEVVEAEAIHALREAAAEFERPVMLLAADPGSAVLLRLAQKAFHPGRIPFPTTTEAARAVAEHDCVIRSERRDEGKAGQVFATRAPRPELWDLYNGRLTPGERALVFPLANWAALDLERYLALEGLAL